MKTVSIIAIAIFALVAVCSSAPIVDQQAEIEARLNIYDDFLAGLFSGLVQTTVGSVSNLLNQLITENPLGIGKRDAEDDLAARAGGFQFIYDNILQDLFSGLVTNSFNHLSNTLTNLIQTNPLGIGKREAEDDLAARIAIFEFLQQNILNELFSSLATNTMNHISGSLNNLLQGIGKRDAEDDLASRIAIWEFLQQNILNELFNDLATNTMNHLSGSLNSLLQGIGKRDAEDDLASRIAIWEFLQQNILNELFNDLATNTMNHLSGSLNSLLQGIGKRDAEDDLASRIAIWEFLQQNILNELFSDLATNTMNHLSGSLNNLLQGIPLIGKRDAEGDLASRVSGLSFIYDNILQDLFSGLVTNSFNHLSNTLTNLIQTNPLGIGKRDAENDLASRVAIWEFLQQNILNELFSDLATNTMNHLSGSLNSLLQGIPLIGKRSVDIQQAQTIIAQTVSTLIEKFKTFAHQISASLSDRQKLTELIQATIADIKSSVANLAQQLSQLIPSAITNEVAQVLALIQSTLVFWTSGLAGSLGPVIGPFHP